MSYREQAFALMRGCQDRGCKVSPPRGMGTNSGCQCFKRLTTPQSNQIIRTLAKADENEKRLKDMVAKLAAVTVLQCQTAGLEESDSFEIDGYGMYSVGELLNDANEILGGDEQ